MATQGKGILLYTSIVIRHFREANSPLVANRARYLAGSYRAFCTSLQAIELNRSFQIEIRGCQSKRSAASNAVK